MSFKAFDGAQIFEERLGGGDEFQADDPENARYVLYRSIRGGGERERGGEG